LTSSPTPKAKRRTPSGAAAAALAMIRSTSTSPSVGRPSVRNSTIVGRPGSAIARASSKARLMSVPAGRAQAADPLGRLGRLAGRLQTVRELAGAGAELDDREAVLGIQVVEDVGDGLLGLDDLLPLHAAGGVEDDHHVLGDDLVRLGPKRGCRQQHEVAGPSAASQ
jgi:hypothetical protein